MHENTEQKDKKHFHWELVEAACLIMSNDIMRDYPDYQTRFKGVIGFPRGGLVPAVALAHMLNIDKVMTTPEFDFQYKANPVLMEGAYLLVDDISDTGVTFSDWVMNYVEQINTQKIQFVTASLCYRKDTAFMPNYTVQDAFDNWVIFPWEQS